MDEEIMTEGAIADPAALRAHYGEPKELARKKTLPRLDRHCRDFIARSPFLVIGSADGQGTADVSPRGDHPGFVQVLDDRTLVIPDRPGNKRVDTLANLLAQPKVGLLFFIPGMNETLRVNGTARITTDPAVLEPLSFQGKAPLSALMVSVEEAFLHCAKALLRARLWDPAAQIDRSLFPPLGRMIADQVDGLDAEEAEQLVQESIQKRFY
jgi:PPOX class probable FMN-dependent enzyme